MKKIVFKDCEKYSVEKGIVFAVKNPWNDIKDGDLINKLKGNIVIIGSKEYEVAGIERFTTPSHYLGEKIGLLVKEIIK